MLRRDPVSQRGREAGCAFCPLAGLTGGAESRPHQAEGPRAAKPSQFACRDLAEQGGSGEGSEGEESGTSGKDKDGWRAGDLEAAPTHLAIAKPHHKPVGLTTPLSLRCMEWPHSQLHQHQHTEPQRGSHRHNFNPTSTSNCSPPITPPLSRGFPVFFLAETSRAGCARVK